MPIDPIFRLITAEEQRQRSQIGLIPSENVTSPEVSAALGSCLSNKYAEGYPGRRYYEGNDIIDQIENLAINRVKQLFDVPYVNVQPYSGSPANMAIYFALMQPGETLMGLKLAMGGHLTHGHPQVTASGRFYQSVQYGVNAQARIDFDEVRALAKQHKPKVIVAGNTAYPFELDFAQFRQIADEVGAWLVADISHVTGLVIGGQHPSPVPHADIIMSTTHKTFRGPRGAMILVTKRGLAREPKLGKQIDAAIIPGLQGGPHNATTAGIAIAAAEASRPAFRRYAQAIRQNAAKLAEGLLRADLQLVGGGTENHLCLIDLTVHGKGWGLPVASALAVAGIYANRNSVPHEQGSPFYPSGVRVGTPLVTTRGMGPKAMLQIADWIGQVTRHVIARYPGLPQDEAERRHYAQAVRQQATKDKKLKQIASEVAGLAESHPLFTWRVGR